MTARIPAGPPVTRAGPALLASARVALLRIALVVFGLTLTALAVTVWLAGDRSQLAMDYEGFD